MKYFVSWKKWVFVLNVFGFLIMVYIFWCAKWYALERIKGNGCFLFCGKNDVEHVVIAAVISDHRQVQMVGGGWSVSDRFHLSRDMIEVHKKNCSRVDNLSVVQMCQVCNECYPSIQVAIWHEGPILRKVGR